MKEPYRKYSGEKIEILYVSANQFLELGKRGFENKEKFEPLPYASIVNLAFSAELFLKYIHESYDIPESGHNLKKLLNNLNNNDKELIISNLRMVRLFRGNIDEAKGDKIFELLENHSNLFVDFRYLHQNIGKAFKDDRIDFGFILDFIGVVKVICDKLHKKN